jgi:hypothetical protein
MSSSNILELFKLQLDRGRHVYANSGTGHNHFYHLNINGRSAQVLAATLNFNCRQLHPKHQLAPITNSSHQLQSPTPVTNTPSYPLQSQ